MVTRRSSVSRRAVALVAMIASGSAAFGIIDSCDDRLLTISEFVDPCGTFLANCVPGEFQVRNAAVGDFCIDPACTVPGQCANNPPIALGTITDLCP